MIKHISRVHNLHADKPIIIMGAGISLPFAIEQALADYPDAIILSCNHRAIRDYRADYAVCYDKPTYEKIRKVDKHIPVIGYHPVKGIEYITPVLYEIINTGVLACWVAKYLGGNPVILCGLDFYQGDGVYYDGRGDVRDGNKTKAYADKCARRVHKILKDRHWISYGGYMNGEYNSEKEFDNTLPKGYPTLYKTSGYIRGGLAEDVVEVEYAEWERSGRNNK